MEHRKSEEDSDADKCLKYELKLKKGRPELTESEREELRAVFNLFAAEGTGQLNTRELKEAMRSLGTIPSPVPPA